MLLKRCKIRSEWSRMTIRYNVPDDLHHAVKELRLTADFLEDTANAGEWPDENVTVIVTEDGEDEDDRTNQA